MEKCTIIQKANLANNTNIRFNTRGSGQMLEVTLTGELFDGTAIQGTDCVKLVGNIAKWLASGH